MLPSSLNLTGKPDPKAGLSRISANPQRVALMDGLILKLFPNGQCIINQHFSLNRSPELLPLEKSTNGTDTMAIVGNTDCPVWARQ